MGPQANDVLVGKEPPAPPRAPKPAKHAWCEHRRDSSTFNQTYRRVNGLRAQKVRNGRLCEVPWVGSISKSPRGCPGMAKLYT